MHLRDFARSRHPPTLLSAFVYFLPPMHAKRCGGL
jgi:hypothetical protein